MQHPEYPVDCPLCGRPLTAIAHAPTTAPWQCFPCMRGWFVTELLPETRQRYIAHMLCYEWDVAPLVLDALENEVAEAILRGTSLRMDQLVHAHPDYLKGIATSPDMDNAFLNMVRAELIRRGIR